MHALIDSVIFEKSDIAQRATSRKGTVEYQTMTVRIILVGTTHPGNIGAAARAMKNMGLTDLVLVRPRSYPHDDATARVA
jgi:tRNA G18 (ribose-2'-O)-methylase SpoU